MSDEERQRFRAAINQIWHSEEVEKRRREMQEANLAYRRALQMEIRKLDASNEVRGTLLKILRLRFSQEAKAPDDLAATAGDHQGGKPDRGPAYSPEEQGILNAARLKAEEVPAVAAAKLNLDRAVTLRERSLASANYRRVMRHAMESADPRVKRILARRDRNPRHRPTDRVPPNDRRRAGGEN
jgi:hypothetical protein